MTVDARGYTVYEPGYDSRDSYMRRLSLIRDRGTAQNVWQASQSAIEANRKAFDEQMRMRRAGLQSASIGYDNYNSIAQGGADLMGRVQASAGNQWNNNSPVGATSGNSLESFINAISAKESGGNYGAVNRHSGALGKYQIMPSNIPSWSRAALGYQVTPAQFLASPQIQEQIARHHLASYYRAYGPAGAAIAWYAGPGAAQNYVRNGRISTRGEANGYPSVANYVNAILRQMGLA